MRKRITDYANENDHPLCGTSDVPRSHTPPCRRTVLRRQGERPGSADGHGRRGCRGGADGQLDRRNLRLLESDPHGAPHEQVGAVQLGVRHWFYEDFVGHFLGLHASWVDYRIGNRRRTYDGRAYGIGISYGYAWILSKRWNLVVEAGAGLYRTRDTRRDPVTSDWGDRYIRHARRWTLAPSKLEVSFNYLF